MKNTLLLPAAIICAGNLLHAQCICSLSISATHKNAIINCSNGSITVSVDGNLCGSIQPVTVTLKDSASHSNINSDAVNSVPDFVFFPDVPQGSYLIVATHPGGCTDSIYEHVPAAASHPQFNLTSTDITAHKCNDGTLGVEISGDYCPSTLNIIGHDTLPPFDNVSFELSDFCPFCYIAEKLHSGVYKVEVYDENDTVHGAAYATVNEPECNFYIQAESRSEGGCDPGKIKLHLLGDYCIPNKFTFVLYNEAMIVIDSINKTSYNDTVFRFNNITPGQYTVKAVYGDDCSSTSNVNVPYCLPPDSLRNHFIAGGTELLTWSGFKCKNGYQVFYRIKYTTGWQKITISQPDTQQVILSGLSIGATYEWKIRTKCFHNHKSVFTPKKEFRVHNVSARVINEMPVIKFFTVSPAAIDGTFNISAEMNYQTAMSLTLYNYSGQIVYSRQNCSASETLYTGNYAHGIYLLQLQADGSAVSRKIIF